MGQRMRQSDLEKDCRVWTMAICLLYDAQTADVVPVMHGQWEPIINAYGELEGWICKRCGTETKQKSNYCPSCGAKMDLEEQNA